jgi:hypothetical protein
VVIFGDAEYLQSQHVTRLSAELPVTKWKLRCGVQGSASCTVRARVVDEWAAWGRYTVKALYAGRNLLLKVTTKAFSEVHSRHSILRKSGPKHFYKRAFSLESTLQSKLTVSNPT